MNQLKTTSKLYNFNEKSSNLQNNLVDEFMCAMSNGTECFIIGDISERTTGFVRGSLMSNLIVNLQELANNTKNGIRIVLKNTNEDLDFYSKILEKVPNIYFHFDRESAVKYSNNTLDEWHMFLNSTKAIY